MRSSNFAQTLPNQIGIRGCMVQESSQNQNRRRKYRRGTFSLLSRIRKEDHGNARFRSEMRKGVPILSLYTSSIAHSAVFFLFFGALRLTRPVVWCSTTHLGHMAMPILCSCFGLFTVLTCFLRSCLAVSASQIPTTPAGLGASCLGNG